MTDQSILWRRMDRPGHEFARLFCQDSEWHLEGTAMFIHASRPCKLDYSIACDSRWRTRLARVTGWIGTAAVHVNLTAEPDGRWRLNGIECPPVTGCLDLDLDFSPSTNLLPIRRLSLAVGQQASVRAAWFRFPSFTLEPLDQIYRRIDATTYRYESAGGRFVAELQVDDAGFVTNYPTIWRAE